jgi:hypothetical protein
MLGSRSASKMAIQSSPLSKSCSQQFLYQKLLPIIPLHFIYVNSMLIERDGENHGNRQPNQCTPPSRRLCAEAALDFFSVIGNCRTSTLRNCLVHASTSANTRLLPFVEWVIKHMAVSGERELETGRCACGTSHCGGYKLQELIVEYLKQHSASSVTRSCCSSKGASNPTCSPVDCSAPAAAPPSPTPRPHIPRLRQQAAEGLRGIPPPPPVVPGIRRWIPTFARRRRRPPLRLPPPTEAEGTEAEIALSRSGRRRPRAPASAFLDFGGRRRRRGCAELRHRRRRRKEGCGGRRVANEEGLWREQC